MLIAGRLMIWMALAIIIYVCFCIGRLVGLTSIAITLLILGGLLFAIGIKEKIEAQEGR